MEQLILDKLKSNHGIGSITQKSFRCHSCGYDLNDCKSPVPFEFPSGLRVQFCDEEELNSWKSRNEIN